MVLASHVVAIVAGVVGGRNSTSRSVERSTTGWNRQHLSNQCRDVIMGAIESQITGMTIVYSTVCSGADQRKHQSSVSLAFVCGIHRWPVNSPHKGLLTRKMFPFYDVIMYGLMSCLWLCRKRILQAMGKQFHHTDQGSISLTIFVRNSNSMEILPCCYAIQY